MRYIHDGELKNRTVEPPRVFVFDEACSTGRSRTDTALMAAALAKQRKTEEYPLVVGHDDRDDRPDRDGGGLEEASDEQVRQRIEAIET